MAMKHSLDETGKIGDKIVDDAIERFVNGECTEFDKIAILTHRQCLKLDSIEHSLEPVSKIMDFVDRKRNLLVGGGSVGATGLVGTLVYAVVEIFRNGGV